MHKFFISHHHTNDQSYKEELLRLKLNCPMFIDGSVWVGTKTGKIFQFAQGKEKTFSAQGVEPVLGSNLFIYTSDEVKNLYVLDSQNKRVVVLTKDGVYMAQYQWQGTLSPSQLVVSEAQKQILLLAEGKIYSVELK